jgi:beta-glucosidase/6-phospho-beta-glucosidase/beta-galactosidase
MRFGIVRVDFETMERTIKASGYWYRDFIAGKNSIEPDPLSGDVFRSDSV